MAARHSTLAFALWLLLPAAALAFPVPLPQPDLSTLEFRNGPDLVATTAVSPVGLNPAGAAYVVGAFTTVDGQPRPHGIARVNPDGTLDAWAPTLPAGQAIQSAVEGGTGAVVLVATPTGGGPRNGILIPPSGIAGAPFASWSANVHGVALDPSGAIYVAVQSGSEVAVQKYGPTGTPDTAFEARVSGVFTPCFLFPTASSVREIRAIDAHLYLGGDFTAVGNSRVSGAIRGAARVSLATGDVDTGWAPLAGSPYAFQAEEEQKATCFITHYGANSIKDGPDNTVYMAGRFSLPSGYKYIARFSKSGTGAPDTSWNPPPPSVGFGLDGVATDPTGAFVYVGGLVGDIIGQTRSGFAAYKATTGELHAWDPGAPGGTELVALPDRVVLRGSFSSVHGAARHRLASVVRPDTANPGPMIALTPRPLAFGNVQLGVPATRELLVRNPGTAPLTIQDVQVEKFATNGTASVTHDCAPQVPAGGQCTIRLEAANSANDNALAPRLTVFSDGTGTPQVVSSTWTIVYPILIMVGKTAFEGGWSMRAPVGSAKTETVPVRNGGAAPMQIVSIATSAPLSVTHDCPAVLAPGSQCQLAATFTPQQAGGSTGTISFTFGQLTAYTAAGFVTTYATRQDVNIALTGDTAADDSDGDGIPNGIEAAEGRDPLVKDNDLFASSRLFAMQQYRDFLAREGDAGGIAYWTQQLDGGATTRASMALYFLTSPEFSDSIAPVARLYFAYFLRVPDYAGLNYWIGQYRTRTIGSISDEFAASPEFNSRYGSLTNGQFVSLVYQNVLGRAPDAAGLAYWTGQLDSGARTRGQVMAAFSESSEYRSVITSEILVTMCYVGMLRRAPEPGGFSYWVNYLDQGNSPLALITAFVNAPEYRKRFLP